jgi:hypothetical protein
MEKRRRRNWKEGVIGKGEVRETGRNKIRRMEGRMNKL